MARRETSGGLAWTAPLLGLCLMGAFGCGHDDPATGQAGRAPAQPEVGFPPVCIGVEPSPDAWSAEPGGAPAPSDAGADDVQPELGTAAPAWRLRDFQPQSCGHEAVYGLEALRGLVTVMAVWSGS